MKIWNKSRIYIFVLALVLFFILTYRFYKLDQKKEKLIDKEYISFLSSQIKSNINNKLQISSAVLKYIVNLQYFKEIAVFDSSGKELFSMAKGNSIADTVLIKSLVTNPSNNDSLLFTGNVYINVIPIKSVLNNVPIGKAILVTVPHLEGNYFMFIRKQLYLIVAFILFLLIIFIKFPEKQMLSIEQSEQDNNAEDELVEIFKEERKIDTEHEIKPEINNKNDLKKIKKNIIKKLDELILTMGKIEEYEKMKYGIDLEDSLNSLNNDFQLFKNNIIHLEEEDAAISEKNRNFILKLKEGFGKIEYFANRLRILSYNAMILANSSGSEGEGFKVVADEMANLSDRIFQFQNEIENEIENDKTNLRNESPLIEKLKEHINVAESHIGNIREEKEKENEKLNLAINSLIHKNKNKLYDRYKTALDEFKLFLEEIFPNLNS